MLIRSFAFGPGELPLVVHPVPLCETAGALLRTFAKRRAGFYPL